jgi:hypothetical protein
MPSKLILNFSDLIKIHIKYSHLTQLQINMSSPFQPSIQGASFNYLTEKFSNNLWYNCS